MDARRWEVVEALREERWRDASDALRDAFCWDATPEGLRWWANIQRKLSLGRPLPDIPALYTALTRPSWDDAPEWAKWRAQDKDGQWAWHRRKPRPIGMRAYWMSGTAFRASPIIAPHTIPYWKDMLEERPGEDTYEDAVIRLTWWDNTVKTTCADASSAFSTTREEETMHPYRIIVWTEAGKLVADKTVIAKSRESALLKSGISVDLDDDEVFHKITEL